MGFPGPGSCCVYVYRGSGVCREGVVEGPVGRIVVGLAERTAVGLAERTVVGRAVDRGWEYGLMDTVAVDLVVKATAAAVVGKRSVVLAGIAEDWGDMAVGSIGLVGSFAEGTDKVAGGEEHHHPDSLVVTTTSFPLPRLRINYMSLYI